MLNNRLSNLIAVGALVLVVLIAFMLLFAFGDGSGESDSSDSSNNSVADLPAAPADTATPALATADTGQVPTGQAPEQLNCGFSLDYLPIRSVEDLYEMSDLVIHGRAKGVLGAINTAKNPGDPTEDHQTVVNLGRIYRVEAVEYFKGTGSTEIEYVQWEGIYQREDLRGEALEDLSALETQRCFNALEPDIDYVLFLRRLSGEQAQFVPIGHPSRFRFMDGEAILDGHVEPTVAENRDYYPERTVEQLLELIRGPS